jgi:replication fork protection complex subunit Csm3/Swi3
MAPSFDGFSSPEPAMRRPPPNPSPPDDLDDLFNYDIDDDPFAEPVPAKSANNAVKKPSGTGLGIDEEVEVSKKVRAPRVKLDENRYITVPEST